MSATALKYNTFLTSTDTHYVENAIKYANLAEALAKVAQMKTALYATMSDDDWDELQTECRRIRYQLEYLLESAKRAETERVKMAAEVSESV